ncbi:histidinol-phosphatase (PHP family) [Salibacterium salarium]|uniref:histidinol-phosphatase HisJ n=1 Tax=Salibacterium salarium TaxID=284579 RepID=UPI002780A027|nr:histidinol-phosphatase HisJ [Salibacterium salarium]MDQ0298554.1 histidinol-phosphatase (PHP family) [Salibacterium salarium]
MSINRDGHIHTPFCPHGSADSFHSYIEQAILNGLQTITFTEHAPLPEGFHDPVPEKDSSMPFDQLEEYMDTIGTLKKEYKQDITILTGLEIDYIEGFEKETAEFLREIGPKLDDSILSVHFLKAGESYTCIDYSVDSFAELIERTGSTEKAAQLYFQTLLYSIESDLGFYKPKRIGHMTLIRKFHQQFPNMNINKHIAPVLERIHQQEMAIDYNGAGTAKPLCGEPYPSNDIAWQAKKRGIPLIYGSDAHRSADMMQGVHQMISI